MWVDGLLRPRSIIRLHNSFCVLISIWSILVHIRSDWGYNRGRGSISLEYLLLCQLRLPVGIIPKPVTFLFLPLVTVNPAPFDQSTQGPDQPPLSPHPVHIGGDLQPHCLGYLLLSILHPLFCQEDLPELPHGSWYASPIYPVQVIVSENPIFPKYCINPIFKIYW